MYSTGVLALFIAFQVVLIQCGGETDNYEKLVKPIAEECKTTTGADDGDVQVIVNNGELTSQTQKCLQYCVYNKMKLQNGVKMAPLEEIVAAYKEIHSNEEEKINNAEVNVKACTETSEVEEAIASGDECALASTVHECFRLQK